MISEQGNCTNISRHFKAGTELKRDSNHIFVLIVLLQKATAYKEEKTVQVWG